MLSKATKHAISVLAAFLWAGYVSAAVAQPPQADLWSGASGFKYDFSSVTPKSEIVGNGETLAIFYKIPVRTAKLLEDYRVTEGTHDEVIPAGTPFIALAANRPSSVVRKSTDPDGDQNIIWCAASYMPTAFCFKSSTNNQILISRANQPTLFDVSPINDWQQAATPNLAEAPLVIEPEFQTKLVFNLLGQDFAEAVFYEQQGATQTLVFKQIFKLGVDQRVSLLQPGYTIRFDKIDDGTSGNPTPEALLAASLTLAQRVRVSLSLETPVETR